MIIWRQENIVVIMMGWRCIKLRLAEVETFNIVQRRFKFA
jgi:hypothetical protein